jgi:hypothetical protein
MPPPLLGAAGGGASAATGGGGSTTAGGRHACHAWTHTPPRFHQQRPQAKAAAPWEEHAILRESRYSRGREAGGGGDEGRLKDGLACVDALRDGAARGAGRGAAEAGGAFLYEVQARREAVASGQGLRLGTKGLASPSHLTACCEPCRCVSVRDELGCEVLRGALWELWVSPK